MSELVGYEYRSGQRLWRVVGSEARCGVTYAVVQPISDEQLALDGLDATGGFLQHPDAIRATQEGR